MRLTSPAITRASAPIRFTFEGREVEALQGESIAAALSAAGILAFRETAKGAPRGLWCGMGACFDCVVTVDGRAGQRACLVKAEAGMRVDGAPPADPAPLAAAAEASREEACDILVVGAGPAGLSAAIAAARAGAHVVVLDERGEAGGQYFKPLAKSHAHAAPDAQFRQGAALLAEARAAGVTIHHGATVWGGFAPEEIAALVDGAATTFRPRRLILAPGAHERPVPVPGWTLPGVMTTGAMQTLARAQRVSPADRVVIAGSGPLNLQLAYELLAGGVRVAAVVEAAPKPGLAAWRDLLALARSSPDLAWDGLRYIATLQRAGVPVIWGGTILACEGTDRFEALRIATPSGERRIEAGAAALNMGFQPETGLARALGCAQRFATDGPGAEIGRLETETDEEGRSSVAGVFAVGDGAAIGGSRIALARGRLAGLAAAREIGLAAPEDSGARRDLDRAVAFQRALWRIFAAPAFDVAAIADATILCRCEEVTAGDLRAAMAGGARTLAALKKETRAGMGRCQGRMCAAAVARLAGAPAAEAAFAAPRAPIRPIPAAALMREVPEAQIDAPVIEAPAPIAWRSPSVPLAPADRACEVLVIGGGVLGLSTALYLAREGVDVLVADRSEPGLAASTANAGSLHVQLLPYDFGDKAEALGTAGPAAATLPLGPRSIDLWKEIARDAGEACGIRTEGGLMLAETEAEFEWLRGKTAVERGAGIETHVLGANELRDVAPYLAPRFMGAAFCPAEGQIDPLRGTAALLALARRAGARVAGGVAITGISREGAGFAVATEGATIRAGRVVVAAGPWSGQIAALAGVRLPVGGLVQQVIATEATGPLIPHLVAHAGRHLSLKQGPHGHLLIGGAWPGTHDPATGATRNRRTSIEGNLWVAGHVVPAVAGLSVLRAWTGMNVHIDRAPILGEAPGCPGLFAAVTSSGYTLGPVCGRMTADAVLGRERMPADFAIARFG
ncbi:FAD-dependent oxidoreductase [Roseomonas sp. PWR1]|uniref:FAD-dependent oxidoreductase n=1 Tax=Roseomonas nitratireducens TaxID=2820810 RepID=A0ABS4AW31_9PROT|nr:FAD-dependent oxidoreductase [Neoroseomonas nitratireducens]MBP0465558.1 FAD-dependent oxidoreductase [Neoroseomonas nitratireducens]